MPADGGVANAGARDRQPGAVSAPSLAGEEGGPVQSGLAFSVHVVPIFFRSQRGRLFALEELGNAGWV